MFLKRDYKTFLTEEVPAVGTGEIAIHLQISPDSDSGFLLLEPGTANEESVYYHRCIDKIAYVYQINRIIPKAHNVSVPVLLVNSIDYLNYLVNQTNEQTYIYKIDSNNLVCKGGTFYIGGKNITINDLDTSLSLPNKTLISNATNYLYIYESDFLITTTQIEEEAYLIATIFIGVSGSIDSFTKHNTYIVGNKGEAATVSIGTTTTLAEGSNATVTNTGDEHDAILNFGIPKGDTGNGIDTIELISTVGAIKTYRINFTNGDSYTYEVKDGEVLPLPNYTITNTSTDRSIDANNTTAEEVVNILGTLYNDIKDGLEAIGSEGRGIVSVNKTNTVGLVDTYTITYTDATTSTFNISNGTNGTNGVGISGITLVSTVGKVNTYRITFTNATTFDFIVTDGADGLGGDMYKSENLSGLANYATARTNLDVYSKGEVNGLIPDISGKQDTLVSGTNIKTINGSSILGSGDIVIGSSIKKQCRMYLDVTVTIVSGTTKTISSGEVVYTTNDSGMSITSGRITITKNGTYMILGQITFSHNATGTRDMFIRKNGSLLFLEVNAGANTTSGSYTTINGNTILDLVIGDYIELRGYQTSGVSLDLISQDSLRRTFLQVIEI